MRALGILALFLSTAIVSFADSVIIGTSGCSPIIGLTFAPCSLGPSSGIIGLSSDPAISTSPIISSPFSGGIVSLIGNEGSEFPGIIGGISSGLIGGPLTSPSQFSAIPLASPFSSVLFSYPVFSEPSPALVGGPPPTTLVTTPSDPSTDDPAPPVSNAVSDPPVAALTLDLIMPISVPEPSTLALTGICLFVIMAGSRFRKSSSAN